MAIPFLALSALATAAVPGLDVVEAGRAPSEASDVDAALLRERGGRLLLARGPRTEEAARELAAELRAIAAMTEGIRSRLPFEVPRVVGSSGEGAAQVAVTEFIQGTAPVDRELAPGSALLAELGAAIAAVHALPRAFATAADLPQRTAIQARESADELVEQAKGTGRLPVTLERRWLAAIDDPTLWQFQPCVSHGGLDLDAFRSVDSRLTAVVDWSDLRIGDPARDLRWVTSLAPAAAEAIVDAYVEARGASVDRQIRQRASLYAELELARWLNHAVALDDAELIADAEHLLDELVGRVRAAESKPLVHETLPVLDLAEVRTLLQDAQQLRARAEARQAPSSGAPRSATDDAEAEHDDLVDAHDDHDTDDADGADDADDLGDAGPSDFLRAADATGPARADEDEPGR